MIPIGLVSSDGFCSLRQRQISAGQSFWIEPFQFPEALPGRHKPPSCPATCPDSLIACRLLRCDHSDRPYTRENSEADGLRPAIRNLVPVCEILHQLTCEKNICVAADVSTHPETPSPTAERHSNRIKEPRYQTAPFRVTFPHVAPPVDRNCLWPDMRKTSDAPAYGRIVL